MKRIILFYITMILSVFSYSQNISIKGTVTDSKTSSPLYLANVYVEGTQIGDASKMNGKYEFKVKPGTYTIRCTYVGYQEYKKIIDIQKDISLDINMIPIDVSVEMVEIKARKDDQNISSANISVVELPIKKIEKLPVIFGETDILKTIQLMPGIQAGGEGSNTFYVRGGGSDQNLITLDGVTVYNPSHAAGFFSVFNADVINSADIFKGGMAPEYGGRMSSIVDIKTKDGDKERYKGKIGVGLLSSHVLAEGPISKGKSSFIFGARRTYADLLVRPFAKGTDFEGISTHFYDLNGKLSFNLGSKDYISLTGYYGNDIFNFNPDKSPVKYNIKWGNGIGSLNWVHFFNKDLTLNVNTSLSDYQLHLDGTESIYSLNMYSGVRDYSTSSDITWKIDSYHKIKGGIGYTHHTYKPSAITTTTETTAFDINKVSNFNANDIIAYIQHEWDITERIKVLYGIRYNYFAHIGPFKRYSIDNKFNFTNIDSTTYKPFETIKGYHLIEPRANIRFSIDEKQSIKASYSLNTQSAHMIPMAHIVLPTDVWYPSTELIKPQRTNQFAIGYFRNFYNNAIETSVELYYKKMDNLIENDPHANYINSLNTNPDYRFVFGKGQSYGAELFINKNVGNLTGWIGYTIGKTTRQFDDIKNGEPFYARHDRRHDVSLMLRYELNEKWDFSTIWVYSTGNAATIPNSFYIIDGNIIVEYGEHNGWRMPDYHRLDLSANWKVINRQKLLGTINFSIYNVYNRKNAYMVSFIPEKIDENTIQYKAYKVTLFPILPSISLNLEFK